MRWVASLGGLVLAATPAAADLVDADHLGAEAVAPTASHDALGLGKWQLNPVVGFVYSFTPTTFLYMGYKHLYSVGGDSARPDINIVLFRGNVQTRLGKLEATVSPPKEGDSAKSGSPDGKGEGHHHKDKKHSRKR